MKLKLSDNFCCKLQYKIVSTYPHQFRVHMNTMFLKKKKHVHFFFFFATRASDAFSCLINGTDRVSACQKKCAIAHTVRSATKTARPCYLDLPATRYCFRTIHFSITFFTESVNLVPSEQYLTNNKFVYWVSFIFAPQLLFIFKMTLNDFRPPPPSLPQKWKLKHFFV